MKTRCGDCKHYERARNPETNRPLPSQKGNCVYPVEWPNLPKSFLPDRWSHFGRRTVQFPLRRYVWKDDNEPCNMFEARVHVKKTTN